MHAHAVSNLDEGLRSFLVKSAPGSSVESLEQAAAFYACENELSEYVACQRHHYNGGRALKACERI